MINDDIKINIDINQTPKLLLKYINELEKYDKRKNEDKYLYVLDIVETYGKSCVLENQISEEMYKKIMKRYGGEI